MPTLVDKSLNLFHFLRELSALQTKRIKRVDSYEEVLFWSDVPNYPECQCIAWATEAGREPAEDAHSGPWLVVSKPDLTSPPEIPDELEPWLKEDEVRDSSLDEPGIFEEIQIFAADFDDERSGAVTESLRLDENESIFEAYINYLDTAWKPWAEQDRRHQAVQNVYNRLFAVFQLADKLGEQYETVVGLGHLVWRSPNSQDIRHPILMTKVRLEFDRTHGIIRVVPSIDGPVPHIEIDFLETADRPTPNDLGSLKTLLDELGDTVWSPVTLELFMRGFINSVSTDGAYTGSLKRPERIDDRPALHLCPTLILRKRTRRTYVDFYDRIINQVAQSSLVPESVRRLVEIVDDDFGSDREGPTYDAGAPAHASDPEVYFPFPANEEQRQIAQRINTDYGLLVQGPPGTGKSHTIRNLICHFLARGQSVLVTSETPRALKVIQNRLPQGLQDLCVTWLGSGNDARRSLERSVNTITQTQTNWSDAGSNRKVGFLREQLRDSRERQAVMQANLVALREKDTYNHEGVAGVYSGTLAEIAKKLDAEKERLGWILDQLAMDADMGFSARDMQFLLEQLRIQSAEGYPDQSTALVEINKILDPAEFADAVEMEVSQLGLVAELEDAHQYPGYHALVNLTPSDRNNLHFLVESILKKLDYLEKHVRRWAATAGHDCAADQDRAWRHLLETTESHVSGLKDSIRSVARMRVLGLDNRDLRVVRHDADVLKVYLESGGRLGSWLFRPNAVKARQYLVQSVRVDGSPCDNPKALSIIISWIDANLCLQELEELWRRYEQIPEGDIGLQLAEYEDYCEPLREAVAIHEAMETATRLVRPITGLAIPQWHIASELSALTAAIRAVDVDKQLEDIKDRFEPAEIYLSQVSESRNAHPIAGAILVAIRQRDIGKYARLLKELAELTTIRSLYKMSCDLKASVGRLLPQTLDCLVKTVFDRAWEGRIAEFERAWAWNRADCWLTGMLEPEMMDEALFGLTSAKERELLCLADLSVELAWQRCMGRLGEKERQALIAWKQAVERIRLGTGRHAETHRQTAREKLSECRAAIPAWVMPLYQVVQTVEPGAGLFDVVIVDEASQSGPDALLLNYIGKRIIVVGDDKQIRPQHVGVNRDDVTYLQQQFLRDVPHSDSYGLESSLYSMAALRFRNRIRLREHFRCMPEIIEFSNQLSYQSEPLVPLRQFGATRLEPVRTVYVPEGYREGQGDNIINLAEAKRLVQQIVECSEESEYEGKTFGVIVLMGKAQAAEIAKMVLADLGAEEFEKRSLLCGTPYDFQGDERDVIFISMVDAPQEGGFCRMDRREETQRKFNVAVSRAKDQLWLFHTPTLNHLRDECFRYQLLDYCLHPRSQAIEMEGIDLLAIKEAASSPRRSQNTLPAPFDSWFEVDVFLDIVAKGYRVRPQFEVAGYRIDLVVIGMKGRLAVECDGDRYHGEDRYLSDLRRQMELERSGWEFKRISSSSFYRDRHSALEGLWTLLESGGIFPECQWEQRSIASGEAASFAQSVPVNDTLIGRDSVPKQDQGTIGVEDINRNHRTTGPAHAGERKRASDFSPSEYQNAIIMILLECPNHSCTRKSLTSRILRVFGVRTRGNPWLEFEKRTIRNVKTLERREIVEEYRAKNLRVRLINTA